MTGAEHYAEAERLIDRAADNPGDAARELLDYAKVHATLALAYAQGVRVRGRGSRPGEFG